MKGNGSTCSLSLPELPLEKSASLEKYRCESVEIVSLNKSSPSQKQQAMFGT